MHLVLVCWRPDCVEILIQAVVVHQVLGCEVHMAINLLPSSLLPNNLLPGQFVLRHFNPKQFFSEHSFLTKTSFKRIVDFLQEKGRVRAYAILLFYFKPPEMLSHPLNNVWPALIGQLGS